MGMFSSIPLDKPIEFINPKPLETNSLISKVRIKIAYHGKNRNGSYISKEVMTDMAERSLGLAPIVGRYVPEQDDFADHSTETFITQDGTLGKVRKTKAFGVVPENPNISWEWFLDEDGVEREYLTCDGYLWTGRYPETLRVLEQGDNNQSMEIDPETVVGTWSKIPNSDEMSFVITEGNFLGLCILGADIEPCFEGSNLVASDFNASTNIKALEYAIVAEEKKQLDEEKREFMKDLEFALNNDPSIISVEKVDNEEEIQEVKAAITELDIAADTEPNPNSVKAIDDAIDTLLSIEQNLDREDVIVPNTEEGAEALSEMKGDSTDIASGPNFDSRTKKATSVNQPFEEEEEMTNNLDPILNQAEKEIPVSQPVAQPMEQPVPAPRVSAEEKRQAMTGGQEQSAMEKMEEIISAMREMEQLKAALQELLNTSGVQQEAKAEEDEDVELEDSENEDKDKKANFVEEEGKEKEVETVKTAEGDVAVEKTDQEEEKNKKEFAENLGKLKQDRKEEGASAATPATMDVPTSQNDAEKGEMKTTANEAEKGEMTPTDAPEGSKDNPGVVKKKNKDISSYELELEEKDNEIARLNKLQHELSKELAFAKDQLKDLKEFKAQVEVQEKEAVLKEFSFLPEEEQVKLRSDFEKLSKDDLESRCALVAYRLGVSGQNTSKSTDIVSYTHEGAGALPDEEAEILAELARFKK